MIQRIATANESWNSPQTRAIPNTAVSPDPVVVYTTDWVRSDTRVITWKGD